MDVCQNLLQMLSLATLLLSHCQAVDKLFAEQNFDGVIHFAGLKV